MMLARLLAGVSLLTSAATAHAECAWVMWVAESNRWSVAQATQFKADYLKRL